MEVASSLDYSKKVKSVPTYRFSRRAPTDQTTVSITPSGGVSRDFKLYSSNEYYNLCRSMLSFLQTPSAVATNYIDMFADCLSAIRSIELTDELSGTPFPPINSVNFYTKLVHYCCTKYEDFLNKPVAPSKKLSTATDGISAMLQRCSVSNVAFSATNPVTVGVITVGVMTITQTTIPYILCPEHLLRADGGRVQDWQRNPMELFLGSSATIDPSIRVNIKLGESLKDTIFAVDKVLPLPSLNLRINFSTSPEIMVENTTDGTAGTFSATALNVNISDLYLYVCYNKDRSINDQLRAEVNSPSGLSVIFPHMRADLRNITLPASATNVNISIQYGPADGQSLCRVYLVPFSGVKTGAYSHQVYQHTNFATNADDTAGTRIASFHTEVNSVRQQDQEISCLATKAEDYMYIKHLLEDSLILTHKQYVHNWFWCDNFSSSDKLVDSQLDSVICGLPTAGGIEWSFVGVCSGVATVFTSCDFRIFSILQKQMNISSNGVVIR